MKLARWTDSSGGSPAQFKDFEEVFARFLSVFIGFCGIVLFFMLIKGGFSLITSGGDPGKTQQAWKTITFAILGLLLIIASYLIIRFIEEFTGVDIGNFQVTRP